MSVDERLLLKATPALLEGWCGPVVWWGADGSNEQLDAVLWPDGRAWVDDNGPLDCGFPSTRQVFLDLSRAECRDRVAVWRVERFIGQGRTDGHGVAFAFVGGPVPALVFLFMGIEKHGAPYSETVAFDASTVPALGDLDHNDDTRLTDGSRLVDALALAAVAREVDQ